MTEAINATLQSVPCTSSDFTFSEHHAEVAFPSVIYTSLRSMELCFTFPRDVLQHRGVKYTWLVPLPSEAWFLCSKGYIYPTACCPLYLPAKCPWYEVMVSLARGDNALLCFQQSRVQWNTPLILIGLWGHLWKCFKRQISVSSRQRLSENTFKFVMQRGICWVIYYFIAHAK